MMVETKLYITQWCIEARDLLCGTLVVDMSPHVCPNLCLEGSEGRDLLCMTL